VQSWRSDANHVTVVTDRDEYQADQLIFTAGAWTAKLLTDLGTPLVVTRQVLGWVWPKKPELFELGRIPAWAIDSRDDGIYYGFPMISDVPGFKLAHHLAGSLFDPDTPSREPRPEDEEDFRQAIRKHIPDADGPLVAMKICMYTNSKDKNFIIDHLPGHPRVQIACGFSGHGFKFASVIGEVLADRAEGRKTRVSVDFLSLGRQTLRE
jgi:sarcosine oxidase